MMAEIWFIRHGESMANAGGRTEGSDSILLTPKGHAQAKNVATIFDQAPDLIIMSPFIRTQLTAAPTIERFPGTPQEIWPIQEISYLDEEKYKNTTFEERRPATDAFWKRRDADYIDGVGAESINQFLKRIRDMVERLEKAPQERIVVFGHGLLFHALEIVMQNHQIPAVEVMDKLAVIRIHGHMPNCHIIRAHTANGKLTLGPMPPAANSNNKGAPKWQNPSPK
jgi:probable phosphoglycerate mutase